jgi:excisionase family DNA binding protein
MDTLLCSIPDAAKALGVGRSKLYELIGERRLETVTIGRRRLVRVDSVRALALGEASDAEWVEALRSTRATAG